MVLKPGTTSPRKCTRRSSTWDDLALTSTTAPPQPGASTAWIPTTYEWSSINDPWLSTFWWLLPFFTGSLFFAGWVEEAVRSARSLQMQKDAREQPPHSEETQLQEGSRPHLDETHHWVSGVHAPTEQSRGQHRARQQPEHLKEKPAGTKSTWLVCSYLSFVKTLK